MDIMPIPTNPKAKALDKRPLCPASLSLKNGKKRTRK